MERKFQFSIGEFYHLFNRGNNKADIFRDENDKKRFVKLLFVCNGEKPVVFKTIQGQPLDKIDRGNTLVHLGAYSLMSNHFHLLVHEQRENGTTTFLEKLLTAYSMYFNKKYERTGTLFEGRCKATHVSNDEHLKYLFSYIHLNPVDMFMPRWKERGFTDKAKVKEYLGQYPYSSYVDYLGEKREETLILHQDSFPTYFEDTSEFVEYLDDWLQNPYNPYPDHPRAALGQWK